MRSWKKRGIFLFVIGIGILISAAASVISQDLPILVGDLPAGVLDQQPVFVSPTVLSDITTADASDTAGASVVILLRNKEDANNGKEDPEDSIVSSNHLNADESLSSIQQHQH